MERVELVGALGEAMLQVRELGVAAAMVGMRGALRLTLAVSLWVGEVAVAVAAVQTSARPLPWDQGLLQAMVGQLVCAATSKPSLASRQHPGQRGVAMSNMEAAKEQEEEEGE